MRRRLLAVVAVPLVASPLLIGAAHAGPRPVEFTDARLKVEINATDEDAGLQIFLDGEAWDHVELIDPHGDPVIDVDVNGPAEDYGLTELFSESSEPPFETFPLEQFEELFPEGTYSFRGTTIDGRTMVGSATLTHDFPDGPDILSPADGSKVGGEDLVVEWAPVTTPTGIHIAGYQVLVVQEEPELRVFSADLQADATKLTISPEFIQPHTRYKVEVLAIEASGNQTLTEITFRSP
jgi:hypothetical protein